MKTNFKRLLLLSFILFSTYSYIHSRSLNDDLGLDCHQSIADTNPNECQYDSLTLVGFYNALVTPLNFGLFWDLTKPMATWEGVTLNENGCVTVLDLHEKGLYGTINPVLGNLNHLTHLALYDNHLTGTIPSQLGNLGQLVSLSLGNNQLTGSIPAQLGNLTNLKQLWLHGNQLSGTIPSQLGNLNNLSGMYLSYNQLTGAIPAQLASLSNLNALYLNNNDLDSCYSSQLAALCQISGIRNETISKGNNFDADWEDFCADGEGECLGCQSDKTALIALYNATDGDNWTNSWDLTQPMSAWYGVALNADGCVVSLDLNNNQLSGTIPSELGNLAQMTLLKLSNNQLSGNIPSQLGNLINLKDLYLNSNQLSGTIPSELGNLNNLFGMYLSYNQLSGSIPSEFGNLINLRSLYLNNNQISGGIPLRIANLSNLKLLRIYNNQMSGCYPNRLNTLCQSHKNTHISDGNNFNANWEAFCFNGSGSCISVWPGDFNYDGSANTMDVLIWGLAAGNSSPVRPHATTDWTAQDCPEAQQNVNGINSIHQDGNGNGIIDEQDLDALSSNYGKAHPDGFTNNLGYGSMEYEIELLSEIPTGGSTTLTYGLSITNGGNPVNIHGLEYAVSVSGLNNYSIQIDASDSSLEPQQTFIRGTNTLNVALTRTDRSNRLCDVVTKIVVVTQDVPEFQMTIHDGHTIQADGTIYAMAASTVQTQAREYQSEKGGYLLQNHPNPFTDNTTIQYHISEDVTNAAIHILDLTGRVVYAHSIDQTGEGQIQINTAKLPSGIYNYHLITDKGVSDAKKMVILK